MPARRAATLCRALCKRVRRAPRPRKRKNLPSFFHGLQVSYSLCDAPSPGHGVTHGAAAAPAAPVACSGCAHLSLLRPAPGLGSGRPQRPARQVSESPAPGAERELDRPRAAPGASSASRTRRKSQMESPGTGGLSAHGVTAAGAPVLGALTPRRVPPRAASDKVDSAAQCSRFHAANPDEPEPRFPCLHAAATLGPRGSRGAVVAQRCLPGLLAE